MDIMPSLVLMCCHETVGVLYTIAKGQVWLQSAVAMLLPMLKFIFRSFFAWYFKGNMEGYATTLMAFQVELFNTLYTSIFMHVLMAVDVAENLSFLYRMNQLGEKVNQINKRGTTTHVILRQVLFRTELVVLVEIVEVLTPLLYGASLLILRHSSNLRYFKAIDVMTDVEFYNSILNLLLLDGFELASLLD